MRIHSLIRYLPLLSGLAYGVSTEQAHRLYDEVCPYKDSQEERIAEGVFVKYHCDMSPNGRRTVAPAMTPEGCALTCKASNGCKGSLWVGQKTDTGKYCYHFGSSTLKPTNRRMVYMTSRIEGGTSGTDDLWPDEDEDECPPCPGPNCQDYFDRLGQLERICPFDNYSHVAGGGKSFKIYCKKLDDYGGRNLKVLHRKTPRECIDACGEMKECKRAVWSSRLPSTQPGTCWLRDYAAVGPVPTTSSIYSSAHVRE